MSRRPEQLPGQDALILANQAGDITHVRNFEVDTETDLLISSNINQLNALSLLSAINQRDFMTSHPQTLARYHAGESSVLNTIKAQREAFAAQAKADFYASIEFSPGVLRTIAARDDVDGYKERQWNRFRAMYASPRQTTARTERSKELRAEITIQQSESNRATNKRPHLPDEARKKRELPKLSSRERLVAIAEDPRAGMMPATNREKTLVMSWLDYLDNPEYPLGVANNMLEIYNHQARLPDQSRAQYGRELPSVTMKSILYEIHDYQTNAEISLQTLRSLDAAVSECLNPTIPLGEDVADHPGLRALIRYRDQIRYRATGITPDGIRDPLVSKEDRRAHEEPEKHKTVEDIYTQRILTPEMAAYIADAAQDITIGEARGLIREAIADQEVRYAFLTARLQDLAEAPDSKFSQLRRLASKLITSSRISPSKVTA